MTRTETQAGKHLSRKRILFLMAGLLFLITGLLRDEAAFVLRRAIQICLGCIGIG